MKSRLLQQDTIAGAVAREILRADSFSFYARAEGTAYKAAWDRRGSSALKHCDAFAADCYAMDCAEHARSVMA